MQPSTLSLLLQSGSLRPAHVSILESYGKEILESASEQFLDLAVEVRLQTISAREQQGILLSRHFIDRA
jgi:hypothetical protein